jgi:murein DD-endopeptidase MepM/ murein hydrolase activator NlpD
MRRALIVTAVLYFLPRLVSAQIDIALPTANAALFSGGGPDFYQFVDRDYQGVKTTPWEGGQYGYVRDPVETPAGIVYTRLHEGIDIKPLQRDASGMPLDPVHAIADGRVAHVNSTARWSNYGCFVVIEHDWGGCHYYSLYAHLNRITTSVGARVGKGQQIGVLGFTGAGIDQRRAHLHLELNLLLNRNFEQWHARYFPTEINHHGIYNGLNLAGLNIARFFLSWKRDPSLSVPDFISRQEVMYKVLIPRSPHFDLPRFYPWMVTDKSQANPPSWEVSFDTTGLPLRIEPCARRVDAPTASMVKRSPVSYALLTNNVITGSGDHFHLSESGLRHMKLLISPD